MSSDVFGRRLAPSVTPAASHEAADWIGQRLLPWSRELGTRVCSVVPEGFEAYGRVLHPAYGLPPDYAPLQWSILAGMVSCTLHAETQWESIEDAFRDQAIDPPWQQEPTVGWCPPEVAVPLRERLSEHTSAPGAVWYAMWVGYPDVMAVMKRAAHFELPGRDYALFRGPLSAADSIIGSPHSIRAGPSLWWPDDREWCVATEVDFRWTYVAGTEQCIRSIELENRLEVLRTQPYHRGDIESDWPGRLPRQ